MDHPVRVDWKILTAEGVECQHIRYHQLQPGDNLNSLVLKYKKSHAVAVVLVNTDDSRQLRPEFCGEDIAAPSKTKKAGLPMIIISSEDGRKLKEFLNRHDPGELHAKIEHKNMPHVEPPVQQGAISDGDYSPSLRKKKGQSVAYMYICTFSINIVTKAQLLHKIIVRVDSKADFKLYFQERVLLDKAFVEKDAVCQSTSRRS